MAVSASDMREAIVAAIATAAELEPGALRDDVVLVELGLDSLDFSTILIEFEDNLGMEVPAEVLDRLAEIEDVTTVGDVVTLLSGWGTEGTGPGMQFGTIVVAAED
jgi:acyl carrier protein